MDNKSRSLLSPLDLGTIHCNKTNLPRPRSFGILWDFSPCFLLLLLLLLERFVFPLFLCTYPETRPPPFLIDIPCCIMFLTDWSGIRDGVLCVNAAWIIHIRLSEREGKSEGERQGILEISSPGPWPWIIDLNWLKFAVITPHLLNGWKKEKKMPHLCLPSLYLFLPSSASSHSNVFQLTARCHKVHHNGRRYNTVSCVRLDFPATSQISHPSPFKSWLAAVVARKIIFSPPCLRKGGPLSQTVIANSTLSVMTDNMLCLRRPRASDNTHAQSGAHSASRPPLNSPNLQVQLRVALGSVFQRRGSERGESDWKEERR